MPELSALAVFLGGVLAILSPCSALLLPAFFAVAFTSPVRLLAQAALFYLGLATIFVPLGAGVSALGGIFIDQRETITLVAGLVLVAFGVLTLAGGGFAIAPRLAGRLDRVQGPLAAYATGLAYGFAGFCTGPILGAVLTVAGTTGGAFAGAALLALYALGMTLPVFVLALVWDRWRIGERRWLRGAAVRIGPLALPASRLVAGLLFVALGAAFVAFQGSSALSATYADLGLADLSLRLEAALAELDPRAVTTAGGLVLGGLAVGAIEHRPTRRRHATRPAARTAVRATRYATARR